MATGFRMLNNYRADQLAYEGLGDGGHGGNGFDLTLLVQGPPRIGSGNASRKHSINWVVHCPSIFSRNRGEFLKVESGGFDAVYPADHCRLEARQANVPMVVSRELRPFYEGVSPNLIKMGKRLEEILDI